MKNLFNLTILSFLLIACKKDVPKPSLIDGEENYKIKFSATGFRTSVEPISKKASNKANSIVNDSIQKMNFFIYNQDNYLVGNYAQTRNDVNFGTLETKLGPGTYKIGVVAYPQFTGLYVSPTDIFHSIYYTPNYDHPYVELGNNNKESFTSGYHEIIVKQDSTYAPIELKRLNAILEIEILDALPNDAAYLTVGATQGTSVQLFRGDDLSAATEYLSNYFDLSEFSGQKNIKLQAVVYQQKKSGSKINLNISVHNSNRQRIKNIIINDVLFKSNFKTKVAGELFGGVVGNENIGVSTTIIKEFEGDIEVDF